MRRPGRSLAFAVALTVGFSAGHGMAGAQNFGTPAGEQYFRIESESGQTKKGQPVLRGYVYNLMPYTAINVRLGVQPVDGGGQAVGAATLGWVNGEISSNSRRFFEVPVAQTGPGYRVVVQSYDLRMNDGPR